MWRSCINCGHAVRFVMEPEKCKSCIAQVSRLDWTPRESQAPAQYGDVGIRRVRQLEEELSAYKRLAEGKHEQLMAAYERFDAVFDQLRKADAYIEELRLMVCALAAEIDSSSLAEEATKLAERPYKTHGR